MSDDSVYDEAIESDDLPDTDRRMLWRVTRNKPESTQRTIKHLFSIMECRCDSAIEAAMLAGILSVLTINGIPAQQMRQACKPQFAISWCKLDFLVTPDPARPDRCFAIECDGAAFHTNKIKDSKRDSFIRSRGIPVYRFSGAEILRCPEDCVMKALNLFKDDPEARFASTREFTDDELHAENFG